MYSTHGSARNVLLLFIVLWGFFGAVSAAQAGAIEITASALNVRTGPGTNNAIIGMVRSGQKYVSRATSGSWHRIDFDERSGWIHGSYTKSFNGTPVTVTVSNKLNVRTGPGSQYRDIGDTTNGQQWVIIATSGSWRKVNYRGGAYWMHGSYLSSGGSTTPPIGDLPTSPAGLVQVPNTAEGLRSYSIAEKRWGTPKVVYGLLRAASKRIRDNSQQGRVSIGNISRSDGSKPASVHKTHYSGRFADMRPLGINTYEGPIDIRYASGANYSRTRTRLWINTYMANEFGSSMPTPLFNDSTLINEGVSRYVSGHHNHIHIQVNN